MLFIDRHHAGWMPAARLLTLAGPDAVILALPRSGVPIGFEIARVLHVPLDPVPARKPGALRQPEPAIGAVADGEPPELVTDDDLITLPGVGNALSPPPKSPRCTSCNAAAPSISLDAPCCPSAGGPWWSLMTGSPPARPC